MKETEFLFWLKGFLAGQPSDIAIFNSIRQELDGVFEKLQESKKSVVAENFNEKKLQQYKKPILKKEEPSLNSSDVAYIINSHRKD